MVSRAKPVKRKLTIFESRKSTMRARLLGTWCVSATDGQTTIIRSDENRSDAETYCRVLLNVTSAEWARAKVALAEVTKNRAAALKKSRRSVPSTYRAVGKTKNKLCVMVFGASSSKLAEETLRTSLKALGGGRVIGCGHE